MINRLKSINFISVDCLTNTKLIPHYSINVDTYFKIKLFNVVKEQLNDKNKYALKKI